MHPNQAAFVRGVHLLFGTWTALKLAVDLDWSGDGLSEEKREWFEGVVVDYFGKHGAKVDEVEMEEILDQIMKDEFNAVLDDDSPYQIAKQLVQLFREVTHGNHSMVERMQAEKDARKGANVVDLSKAVETEQPISDDDDGSDRSGDSDLEDNEMT